MKPNTPAEFTFANCAPLSAGDIVRMNDGNYWRVGRIDAINLYCVMYRVPWYKNAWWRLKDWFYRPFEK